MPPEFAHRPHWHQLSVTFAAPHTAERHFLTRLGPALRDAEAEHLITAWFFIRKQQWRLRYLPNDTASADQATAALHSAAQQLCDSGAAQYSDTIYEPETHAFGGPEGMRVAHELFHADSCNILARLTCDSGISRDNSDGSSKLRELSLLLCTALMRSAGLDRYEQGDVWAQLAAHRPRRTTPPSQQWHAFTTAVQRLTTVDTGPGTTLRTGTLAFADGWLTAFEHAGRTLRSLSETGGLTRGVRAVITHHIIFHWNRLGLPASTQSALVHAAKDTAFADPRGLPMN